MQIYRISEQRVEEYNVAMPLLRSMNRQFQDFTKKKQDAAVSTKKLSLVNRLLEKVRDVLEGEQSLNFLDLLDEDDMPQNSDIALVLSQYVAAMESFKDKHSTELGSWQIQREDEYEDEDDEECEYGEED